MFLHLIWLCSQLTDIAKCNCVDNEDWLLIKSMVIWNLSKLRMCIFYTLSIESVLHSYASVLKSNADQHSFPFWRSECSLGSISFKLMYCTSPIFRGWFTISLKWQFFTNVYLCWKLLECSFQRMQFVIVIKPQFKIFAT